MGRQTKLGRSEEKSMFHQKERRKKGRKEGRKERGLWEPAKHSGLISSSKKERGREEGGGGEKKVSAVQSALTDVLYIACHFILQEYWGVAKLKPGRYSNPSPALLPALVGGG